MSVKTAGGDASGPRAHASKREKRPIPRLGRNNREYVREASGGRAGYIHIPDMGPRGYAEFHRHFLREYDCDGLDRRRALQRRRAMSRNCCSKSLPAADRRELFALVRRRSRIRAESPAGPMVALTNEFAGSDGDIFWHTFKMIKPGPLIGREPGAA